MKLYFQSVQMRFSKIHFSKLDLQTSPKLAFIGSFYPSHTNYYPILLQKVSCLEKIKFTWERAEPKQSKLHFINYK